MTKSITILAATMILICQMTYQHTCTLGTTTPASVHLHVQTEV